ncbi:NADH-quinone oxidoreductase subunit A [Cytophagaceae bacterium ABcell3]|nr:NADH-quinone oxidoreductase subunit A [Cytophagaceae bacterium ABcell3]
MENEQISEFGNVLLFIIGGFLFVLISMAVSRMLSPSKPDPEKLQPYECGEEAIGNPWVQFNTRFYVIALIFLLFEVEIVFLFPWSVVFGQKELIEGTGGLWGWFALGEVFIFALILALGLAYAWVKGHLDWIIPQPEKKEYKSPVPRRLYDELNERYK